MKYRDQQELVSGLRALADFIEDNIDLPIHYPHVTLHEYIYDDTRSEYVDGEWKSFVVTTARSKARKIAKILGTASKDWNNYSLNITKKFGDCVKINYSVERQAICRKVVKGVKEVPEQVIPARTEEIVEWECDEPSLLAS